MEPLVKLNQSHETFALEYVRTRNATVAYRLAYPDAEEATTKSRSSTLLADPLVAGLVRRYQEVLAEVHGVDASRVIEEMKKIAFSEVTDAVELEPVEIVVDAGTDNERTVIQQARLRGDMAPDTRGAIQEISTGPNGAFKVKMHSKLDALKSLGQHLGLFEEKATVQVNVTHNLSEAAAKTLARLRELKKIDSADTAQASQ